MNDCQKALCQLDFYNIDRLNNLDNQIISPTQDICEKTRKKQLERIVESHEKVVCCGKIPDVHIRRTGDCSGGNTHLPLITENDQKARFSELFDLAMDSS